VEKRNEPLSERERKLFRRSALWTVAYLSLFAAYILLMLVDDMGWVDYAALLGVQRHTVWVFLSEILAIPVWWACMVGWGLSCVHGLAVVMKRPICLLWIVGPPMLVFLWVAFVVICLKIGRPL
jgi:hypothetical protein